MAERQPVRVRSGDDEPAAKSKRRRAADDEDGRPRRRSARPASRGMSAADAAKVGLRQIAELTGKRPEGVTGVERTENGWIVGVEVVEDRRIPSSTDILAIYEAEFDQRGELSSYRRTRRYSRGRGDADDSGTSGK